MMKNKMTLERAEEIVRVIVAGHKRWGASAGAMQHSTTEVVDALVTLHENANMDGPSAGDMAKANRQLAAANAREQGYKSRVAALQAEIASLEKEVENLNDGNMELDAKVRLLEAKVEFYEQTIGEQPVSGQAKAIASIGPTPEDLATIE